MTDESHKDTRRAIEASKVICDGRDPVKDFASILITLDHTIATILLATSGLNPKKAVSMLNEGTVLHVEERIMLYANKKPN